MKLKLAIVALAAALNVNAATVLVSDFGTGFAPGFGDWFDGNAFTSSGVGGTTSFTAPATDGGSFIEFTTIPDLTGFTTVAVTARVDAGNASNFTVLFYSAPTEFASADFTAAEFTGSFTTVTKTLSFTAGYDPVNLIGYGINGGTPSGTSFFRYTFDSISTSTPVVVPEPSTYASLAGVVVLGFVAYRRRRISKVAA